MITYRFQIEGTAANDQTWGADGLVDVEKPGQFIEAVNRAIGHAFEMLTEGKAVYGKPGVGCNGPYAITLMKIGTSSGWVENEGEHNA